MLGSKFHDLKKTITRAARVRCLYSGKLTLHPHVSLSLRFYPNYCKPLSLTSIGFVGKKEAVPWFRMDLPCKRLLLTVKCELYIYFAYIEIRCLASNQKLVKGCH